MPWQAVPPLIIIGGAFAVSGLLLNGFDRLTLGRNRRVQIDEFIYNLDNRDKFLKAQAAMVLKAEKAAAAAAAKEHHSS